VDIYCVLKLNGFLGGDVPAVPPPLPLPLPLALLSSLDMVNWVPGDGGFSSDALSGRRYVEVESLRVDEVSVGERVVGFESSWALSRSTRPSSSIGLLPSPMSQSTKAGAGGVPGGSTAMTGGPGAMSWAHDTTGGNSTSGEEVCCHRAIPGGWRAWAWAAATADRVGPGDNDKLAARELPLCV